MTVTPLDLQALTEILNRTPMTTAEGLFLTNLMDRLRAAFEVPLQTVGGPIPMGAPNEETPMQEGSTR